MKKKTGLIGLVFLIMISIIVSADSNHGNFTRAIDIINAKTPYSELSDEDFEVLGDYYMEIIHPYNHEYMDEMMGGEGSESLKQMHIAMGKNFYAEYLDTGLFQTGGVMDSMMYDGGGYSMMSGGFGTMMSPFYGHSYSLLGFLPMLIFWGLVIWMIVWLINRNKPIITNNMTPLDILKQRYAKGEINKKEFEDMKKEFNSGK